MKATFLHREQLTDTISSFSFQPDSSYAFTAGQYVELTLLGHQENGAPAKRWFTLSSSPSEELLTITTRVGNDKHLPFKRALDKLATGAIVNVSEPMGDFVLPKLLQTPLLFVAGGIGITPFRSILQWLADTTEDRPITLIQSVRTEDDIIFQDTFNAAGQHVTVVVEEPSAAWGGERGVITAEMVLGIAKPTDDTLIYISGPEPFVQTMQTALLQDGVSNQRLVLDEFQGYSGI